MARSCENLTVGSDAMAAPGCFDLCFRLGSLQLVVVSHVM